MPSYAAETLASIVGGSTGLVVGAPLDFVKTHLQSRGGGIAGVVEAINQSGLRVLFRGALPPLVGATLYQIVAFPSFKFCLDVITDSPQPSLTHMMLAGTGAGLLSSLITTPFEMVKVKLMLHGPATSSHFTRSGGGGGSLRGAGLAEVARLHRLGGVPALYTGLSAMAFREGPGSGVYFGFYHSGKRKLQELGVSPSVSEIIAGGCAGVACWMSVLPFDVCKTRIQADAYMLNGTQGRYSGGLIRCVRLIIAEEGISSLFLGWRPLVARAFLVNSTTFFIYEQVLEALEEQEEK